MRDYNGSASLPKEQPGRAREDAQQESAMKPHEVDPSLLSAEPPPQRLDDGFSPPPEDAAAAEPAAEHEAPVLRSQSLF